MSSSSTLERPCPHEPLELAWNRRWVMCRACHRGAAFVAILERVGLAAPWPDVVKAARAIMDEWTPEYFLEVSLVTARSS